MGIGQYQHSFRKAFLTEFNCSIVQIAMAHLELLHVCGGGGGGGAGLLPAGPRSLFTVHCCSPPSCGGLRCRPSSLLPGLKHNSRLRTAATRDRRDKPYWAHSRAGWPAHFLYGHCALSFRYTFIEYTTRPSVTSFSLSQPRSAPPPVHA